MKTQLTKKFYALLIIAILLIGKANAQIVYTDVNPDQALGSVYQLDLNNDAIVDFSISHSFTHTSYTTGNIMYRCYHNHYAYSNSIATYNLGGVAVSSGYASALPGFTVIDSSLIWNTGTYTLASSSQNTTTGFCPHTNTYSSSGNWNGASDKYLGLRIKINGLTYYGWARLSGGATGFTIKDYAFNNVADQPILAGENSCIVLSVASPVCAGNNISVPYTLIGSFDAANILTAELSDAAGSFISPVAIGNTTSNVSGSINALIPAGTIAGNAYRIRIITTNPARISSPENNTIIINTGAPVASISSGVSTANCGTYMSLSAISGNGNTYQWKLNGIDIVNATGQSFSASSSGDYTCQE